MEIPRHWRLRKQRYALVGEVCPRCEAKLFPPRVVCPKCARRGQPKTESTAETEGSLLPVGRKVLSEV